MSVRCATFHGKGRHDLYIEAEVHDVTILHDVFLAFNAHFSGFAYSGFRSILDIVVVFDDLWKDEYFIKVSFA